MYNTTSRSFLYLPEIRLEYLNKIEYKWYEWMYKLMLTKLVAQNKIKRKLPLEQVLMISFLSITI